MIYWNKGDFYPTIIKDNHYGSSIVYIILAIGLLCAAAIMFHVSAEADQARAVRRSIVVLDTGEHVAIPYPGECNEFGCVLVEKEVPQWNGTPWLHQFVDTDGDDVCDVYRIWKPLEDPTYGIFYTIYKDKPCGGAI